MHFSGITFPREWSEDNYRVTHLLYADDAVFLCQDLPAAQRILIPLIAFGAEVGIRVSLKKTKLMRLSTRSWNGTKSNLYNHISETMEVSVGGVNIQKVNAFCYLGHMMAKDGCAAISDAAIKYRKVQERAKMAQIKPLLDVVGPSPKWRADVVKTFCLNSLTHGSEALIYTEARIQSLNVPMTECRFLILNKRRRKTGRVSRMLRKARLVLKTRRFFYTHILDIVAKKNLNFLMCNVYPHCPSSLVRKLLFTHLIPDSGDYRLRNGGQTKSSFWASYVRYFTWATGITKPASAKTGLLDLVKEVYAEAIERRKIIVEFRISDMAERMEEFGGVSEDKLLFDRGVHLELGTIMKTFVKCKVQQLFEEPAGIAYRDAQVKSWNSIALAQAKLTKCSAKDCYKEYSALNGLRKHTAYCHVKQPDPSKATKKVKVQDSEAYANQQYDHACPVENCYMTYKALGVLRTHAIKAHKFSPYQVRQAGLLA